MVNEIAAQPKAEGGQLEWLRYAVCCEGVGLLSRLAAHVAIDAEVFIRSQVIPGDHHLLQLLLALWAFAVAQFPTHSDQQNREF